MGKKAFFLDLINKLNSSTKRKSVYLALLFSFFIIIVISIYQLRAVNVNYTICNSGCDFTTLYDALSDPALDGDSLIDTLTISPGYVFNYANETAGGTTLNVPSGVTIECEIGADVFGDKTQTEMEISANTDFTLQNCTTENVRISLYGTNVKLLNNTFSTETNNWITPTAVDGFEISGNVGIQRIQLQGSDNGLIENNDIECRQDNNCLQVVTAGAPDYSDPPGDPLDDHICNNVLINNNRIVNHIASGNTGDWILVNGGENIQITNNTISSAVTLTDDPYLVMISIQNAQAEFKNNYIITPEKTPGSTNATWAFNVRVDEYHIDALYEHNTIYGQSGNETCFGYWDGMNDPTINVNITNRYNLCYNNSSTPTGNAVVFSYDSGPGDASITFTDSFNGFYNFPSPYVYDQNSVITSLNANTLASDPLLRSENVDTTDDNYPSPISRYLDADGLIDIGAYGDPLDVDRIDTYLIDTDCTVDYVTCFSNTSEVLPHAISTDDTITINDGTYSPITLNYPATNVTLSGESSATIFDAAGNTSALSIANISNSNFSNFQAIGSAGSITSTYYLSHMLYDFGGDRYNESMALGFPTDDVALIFTDSICSVAGLSADNTDVTAIVDTASDDWNLVLFEVFGVKNTGLIPNRFASSAAEFITYALNQCGGAATVDVFLPVFTVSNQEYTYNSSAISSSGATLVPGLTDPPSLQRSVVVPVSAGLILTDSDNNNFSDLNFNNNNIGLYLNSNTTGNTFTDSTWASNSNFDLNVTSAGTNDLNDPDLSLAKINIDGTGSIDLYYSLLADVSSSSGPIDGATVEVRDTNDTLITTLTTAASGQSPLFGPIIATSLSGSGPYAETSGGINPFSFTASATGFGNAYSTENLNSAEQTFSFTLNRQSSRSPINPSNITFFINNDSESTTSRQVTLNITAQNASGLSIFSDPNSLSNDWLPFTGVADISWQLPEGLGEKTVCIRLRSDTQTISDTTCQTITLVSGEQTPTAEDVTDDSLVTIKEPRHEFYGYFMLNTLLNLNLTISTDKNLFPADMQNDLCPPETLIKLASDNNQNTDKDTTVYYCGTDGMRYVFPNEATYFSWYTDFSSIQIVSPDTLTLIPIGGNVTIRPGSFIARFDYDENLYAVAPNGFLRQLTSESVASQLYGPDWQANIVDLSDALWPNYQLGEAIFEDDI